MIRGCSGRGRTFDHYRKSERVCPDCRTAIRSSAIHTGHRLAVVRQRAGGAAVAGVLAALEDEGFIVAPPGSAVVPGEWLIALRRLIDPEEIGGDPLLPRVALGSVRDHVRNLPPVERITATTGDHS